MSTNIFRTEFSEAIFNHKYKHEGANTWEELSDTLVDDVCRDYLSKEDKDQLKFLHSNMKFTAGGRYLYYAGRANKFFNNCFLLKSEEDTREDWANLSWKAESCLTTGGGIGNDYSIYRAKGSKLSKTGGLASGPISKMKMINEIGREVMQGGSRRSAIYGSLNWKHNDAYDFLHCKDWFSMPVAGAYTENGDKLTIGHLKEKDFNYPAPLDMTNISLNYDNSFLEELYGISINEIKNKGKEELSISKIPITFVDNCRQALMTGEPGFSFNFFSKENETLRNAPLSKSTWVYTSIGYKKIEDIIETPIILWTGKQWAATKFSKTRTNDPVLKITFSGRREIIASKDHPFILDNEEKVNATNLKIGDKLKIKHPVQVGGKSVSDAYLLAFIYGDGSFSSRYSRAEVALCGAKEKLLPYLSTLPCVISRDLRNILRVYYKNNDIFRQRTKQEFPEEVYSWNEESRINFLSGLLDADGDDSRGFARLSSIQFEFLKGVQRLCDSLGLVSYINKGSKGNYKNSKESWNLSIKGKSSILNTHRLELKDSDYEGYLIRSIEEFGQEDVYCCDVKVEEHSFMAEGVLVSNCTEVTSEDDSDVCNLASMNMSQFDSIDEWRDACNLASRFLLCGTLVAQLPYKKVYEVREKNRRLGLGLMGVHEWLLKRNYRYEVVPELHEWLKIWKDESEKGATELANKLGISVPVAFRAIAPTGSLSILNGTTSSLEPLFAVAYKRRFLKGDKEWHYQYVVDGTAKILIQKFGINPDNIETALSLSSDYERRIKFQADVQDYVDMSISSTINMPKWGSELNNDTRVTDFAKVLAKYAHRLRGFTCYPDEARGGQPLTIVDYYDAKHREGEEFKEEFHDVCEITGKGGTCGV